MIKINVDRYYSTILLLILLFAFVSRVFLLHKPVTYIFDEVYHAATAKLMARNDPRAFEWWNPPPEPDTAVDWLHPPLAKYTQAFFIYTLGENAFSWRFSSALFGTAIIWLTALLAKELFENKALSLLAALLAAFDGLLLVMSRIAMNDIHVAFFILLTLLFYFKHLKLIKYGRRQYQFSKWLLLTGVAGGLATATKWSGVFALLITGLIEAVILSKFYLTKKNFQKNVGVAMLNLAKIAASLVVVPAFIYLLSYAQMFWQGKDLTHLIEMHNQTWRYQINLEATHPAQSKPWQWFLNLKPVWIAVERQASDKEGNIYAVGNPLLFWLGAATILWTLGDLLVKKGKTKGGLPLLYLLAVYLAVWLPWQFSPRIMFFYHYTPAVPLLCIILAYWLWQMWIEKKRPLVKKISLVAVVLIAVNFAIWYPHWTNIAVSPDFADSVYFIIKSWKN